ncbi:hypothetical protein SEA_CECE_272 [Microbacterium phage Cece]|nr:hypothetical protein SEA_CECE_272 [Microbacterium phage Cece]
MSIESRLDDIIEDHLEGPLFRDPNIPRVNSALSEFRDALLKLLTEGEYEYGSRSSVGLVWPRETEEQARYQVEDGPTRTPVRRLVGPWEELDDA